jgi:protein RecA
MAEKKAKKSKIKSEKKRNDDIMDSGSENEENIFQPSKINWGCMISTGSTLLDLAICGQRKKWGGLPTGILVEIAGESSSGKTALLTEIAARGQKKGGDIFFCDPEARLDKEYAEITGLNIRDLGHYEQPDTVTEVFELYNGWGVDPEVPNVFACDSLAALSTKMEMEDGDKMGMRRAKEFSEGLRKTCRSFAKKNVLMVCSNQIRDGGPNGSKTIPGGNAVPFYSSVRMRVSPGYPKSKIVKEKTIRGAKQKKVIGIQSLVKITKNSLDDPFREVPIFLVFGYGIDDVRGNLTWYKESNNSKKFLLPDGTEQSSIDKAIEYVEENGLEKKLRIAVRKLWLEIEESFKTQRKPKEF